MTKRILFYARRKNRTVHEAADFMPCSALSDKMNTTVKRIVLCSQSLSARIEN